jgi:putative ABC transport system ATP-binding protein
MVNSANDPLLTADDLHLSFGSTQALNSASLRVYAGEVLALMGPSGSGKSTLLHLMAGLDRPTSGSVLLDGRRVEHMSDRELAGLRAWRVGVVFQQFFLLDSLTAQENVASGLLYRGIPARQRRKAAVVALDRVGLAHRLRHRVGKLSGGERQRVAIARAVVGRPAIVFADEPTGNLDSANEAEILDVMRDLNRTGTTLVVITHEERVADVCGRRIDLRDGVVES